MLKDGVRIGIYIPLLSRPWGKFKCCIHIVIVSCTIIVFKIIRHCDVQIIVMITEYTEL